MGLIIQDGLCPVTGDFIVHCVSADGVMAAGFAAQLDRRHRDQFQRLTRGIAYTDLVGTVIPTLLEDDSGLTVVANMITKQRGYHKPTLEDFKRAVEEFACFARDCPRRTWHAPRIGCGLDGLSWDVVEPFLRDVAATMPAPWVIHIPPVSTS